MLPRGRCAGLALLILLNGPPDAGSDLRGADGAGQVWVFAEKVHQVAPGFGAFLPRMGVADRVDQGHDTVADKGHGKEVLGAFGVEQHSG